MRPEKDTLGTDAPMAATPAPKQYATRAEVDAGLNALTDADYAKLMMIAATYCCQRRLTLSACEPEELLNQAVLKTLECEEGKRWNKTITMVRHLDRAMQNISGHLVRERMKVVAFPDGLNPSADDSATDKSPADAATGAAQVSALLKSVFGPDERAREVFILRKLEDFRPDEVQAQLKIGAQEYETINRRILRKISQFVTKKST